VDADALNVRLETRDPAISKLPVVSKLNASEDASCALASTIISKICQPFGYGVLAWTAADMQQSQ
jgi:hypothetical protein